MNTKPMLSGDDTGIYYALRGDQLYTIMEYLGGRPYAEVRHIMAHLESIPEVKIQVASAAMNARDQETPPDQEQAGA